MPSCDSEGVQENAPPGVTEAPVGAPTSENSRVSAVPPMTSPSEAVAVNASDASSSTLLEPTDASTGSALTSLTVTVTASESLPPLPSSTCMVMMCVPSCDSEGVQENAPDVEFIEAPDGGVPASVNSRASLSPSVAVAVKESVASSWRRLRSRPRFSARWSVASSSTLFADRWNLSRHRTFSLGACGQR